MAKRRLKTILNLAEQKYYIEPPKAFTDFASIILNSDIVFLDENNLDELSSNNNLVSKETENISGDNKIESTTEYLTADENHFIFEESKEIIDFSELYFSDLFNYNGASEITINKECEVSKIPKSLEKVESSTSNFINHGDASMITYEIDTKSTEDMENENFTNLIEKDADTMITYETDINKSTVDIEDNSLDCDTTITKKKESVV